MKDYIGSFKPFLFIETLNKDIVTKTNILKLSEEPIITLTAQRAFNKKVTVINGAEKLQVDLELLLKHLKNKLAASGAVADAKTGIGKEVMVQGKHLDAIKELFMKELKIPEKQIKIIDKIGDTKKKRKKH